MSQYAFYFDGTRCTGCKTCEMSCKDFNDLSTGITFRKVLEATLGETVRDESGVITTTCISYPVSLSCNHCDSPICMAKCPQGAISKDPDTGFVSNDLEKCIGCGTCVTACPYGAPTVDEEQKKSVKCTQCGDRVAEGKQPICVEACPVRALDFGEIEDLRAKYGDVAEIAPLPEASLTKPNLVITAPAQAKPANDTTGTVENEVELV